jgi:phage-related protein
VLNDLGEGFFEFKNVDTGLRVPFYYDSENRNVIVLTHYFEKKRDKTPQKELSRMKEIKEQFIRARRGS